MHVCLFANCVVLAFPFEFHTKLNSVAVFILVFWFTGSYFLIFLVVSV